MKFYGFVALAAGTMFGLGILTGAGMVDTPEPKVIERVVESEMQSIPAGVPCPAEDDDRYDLVAVYIDGTYKCEMRGGD